MYDRQQQWLDVKARGESFGVEAFAEPDAEQKAAYFVGRLGIDGWQTDFLQKRTDLYFAVFDRNILALDMALAGAPDEIPRIKNVMGSLLRMLWGQLNELHLRETGKGQYLIYGPGRGAEQNP